MNHPASARLLLDEMFSPAIAAALRDLGQDVIAVAEHGELRAMSDDEVFAWAISQRRWLLTENVKVASQERCKWRGLGSFAGDVRRRPRQFLRVLRWGGWFGGSGWAARGAVGGRRVAGVGRCWWCSRRASLGWRGPGRPRPG
jgi:Domain of unknown function (DUF5615)